MACSRLFHFSQVLLQIGAAVFIVKRGKWYYKVRKVLKSGAIFIKKWGKYYRTGQLLLESGAIITKECSTFSLIHSWFTWRQTIYQLKIHEKLKFSKDQKKEEIKPPPQSYLRHL